MRNDVVIICTGGTFNKSYDPIRERFVFETVSIVPTVLKNSYIQGCAVNEIMKVDSLDMTDANRQELISIVSNDERKKFVIVHGTSRMVETAEIFDKISFSKTIVFTGALKPYLYESTEASANLGGAIGVCRTLPEGVYIYMHGRVYNGNNCVKNPSTGLFDQKR